MKSLKDVLISAGGIDRYFEDKVPVNLWHAKNFGAKESIFGMVE